MDHDVSAILFYSPGGGLGHLTRSLAVIRHLRTTLDNPILLWTTSPFAHLAVAEGVPVMRWPGRSEWQGWPGEDPPPPEVLNLLRPGGVVVDTFAEGPRGELTNWLEGFDGPKILVRRPATIPRSTKAYDLVLDPVPPHPNPHRCYPHPYAAPPGIFDTQARQRLRFPPLTPGEREVGRSPLSPRGPGGEGRGEGGQPIGYILHRSPEEAWPPETARRAVRVAPDERRSVILALHAGPPEETLSLFHQVLAASERLGERVVLRLATPVPLTAAPDLSPWLVPLFPASLVFNGVDLIIGGAGYNLVSEARAFGRRAVWRPFLRPADDQWDRVRGEDAFGEATAPEELADLINGCLARPAPPALPRKDREGARMAAQLIASVVGAAAVR